MRRSLFDFLAASIWMVHFGWTILLAVGSAVVFFVPWYAAVHLVLISGTLLLNLALRDCPLSMVERVFHVAAGHPMEHRSFTERLFGGLGWNVSLRSTNLVLMFFKIGSYTAAVLTIIY